MKSMKIMTVLLTASLLASVAACNDNSDDPAALSTTTGQTTVAIMTTGISTSESTIATQPNTPSGSQVPIDLSSEASGANVPLLMQTDERWGSADYAGETIATSGCGPVCLSMASLYLTGNASYTPTYIAEYAQTNGYSNEDGTNWTLITNGAQFLGLSCAEVPLEKTVMTRLLQSGVPLICAMGPGDFTQSGYYIVLTGIRDGKFTVNDPNSAENSAKAWSYDEISSQIRNTWALWGTKLNTQQYTVTSADINVREDASIDAKVKYRAGTDKTFTIDKITNGGGYIWGHMNDGNWICMSYVKKV